MSRAERKNSYRLYIPGIRAISSPNLASQPGMCRTPRFPDDKKDSKVKQYSDQKRGEITGPFSLLR